MKLVVMLFITLYCIYLFPGLHVLLKSPRRQAILIFFSVSLCASVMALGGVVMQVSEEPEVVNVWYKVGTFIGIVMMLLFLALAAEISGLGRIKLLLYVPFTAFALLLVVRFSSSAPLMSFERIDGIRRIFGFRGHGDFTLYSAYVVLSLIAYSALLAGWKRRTVIGRNRRQAQILVFGFLSSVALLLTYLVLLSYFLYLVGLRIPGEHILFFLPWFAAVYYCIIRFHFLTMTPEFVSRKLIENIDESVILLDDRKRIVYVNKMIGGLDRHDGGRHDGEGRPGGLSDLVVGHRALEREIDRILQDNYGTFVCRCTYRSGKDEEIPVHAKVSLVRDSFGDVLGVMIVGKRVKEMRQLKTLYRLTAREGELLQYLMAGRAYEEAAGEMGISINTLKRHVSNIYNKLGIETRVELMNLFRDYDLLPPQRADRTVFLFTDREVRP